jgi:hypothetical protein
MAITCIDHLIFLNLKQSGCFAPLPSLLELGEAKWFGDVSTEVLCDDIEKLVQDKDRREQLQQQLVDILCADSPAGSRDLAKLFYKVFLD